MDKIKMLQHARIGVQAKIAALQSELSEIDNLIAHEESVQREAKRPAPTRKPRPANGQARVSGRDVKGYLLSRTEPTFTAKDVMARFPMLRRNGVGQHFDRFLKSHFIERVDTGVYRLAHEAVAQSPHDLQAG